MQRNINIQMSRHSDRNTGIDIFQFILQRMRRRAEIQFESTGEPGDDDDIGESDTSSNDTTDEENNDALQINSCNPS